MSPRRAIARPDPPPHDAEAASWLRRAADQGRPEAQTILGVMYVKGRGVAQNDAKAAKWFEDLFQIAPRNK